MNAATMQTANQNIIRKAISFFASKSSSELLKQVSKYERIMKSLRIITLLAGLMLAFAISASAQLTGTKNIPGDYADLATAITDLNTQGVGAGGVTFNLVAGNPQTAPAGGYVIGGAGSLVLTTASAANPIVFTGNGNTITASGALTAGALNDGIFKLIGADFTTIQGFTMEENAANTTTAAGTNNMTEWGVALLYVTTTDGAQSNSIVSNTIDLNRTYQNTFGIYSNSTHTATAVTTSATATGASGGNHNLTIGANNITDVNNGIVVVGPTAAADHNDILTITNVNTITNYGTTGTFSSYANVSGTVYGILVRNTKNYNVSFNSITSSSGAGGVTAGTLRGIYVQSASNQPTGTFTNNINNNTLAVTSHVLAGTLQGITVESTTSSPTSTTNINSNNFTTLNHTIAAATGAITAISQSGSATAGPLVTSVSSNTFTNITSSSTGSFTFISDTFTAPTNGTKNVNNNSIVTAFNKTGAGGTVTGFVDAGSSTAGTINNSNNNSFTNITVTGATAVTGINNNDGGSPTRTVNNNTVGNIIGGSGAIIGITTSFDGGPTTVSGNTVSSITGSGTITGMSHGSGAGLRSITQNTVHTLTGSGTGTVTGILNSATTILSSTLSRNKVYGISNTNAGGAASGITVSGGTTVNVQNNLVGDITTPAANATIPLTGINVSGGTTVNVDFNTVYLNATSTGALFGSAAINASTAPTLTLRSNIFVNLSTPTGTGETVAYRRTTTTLTTYGASSNNNLFYAGTPSAVNLIFTDLTTDHSTLAGYKALVAPRDSASVTENPPFLSTSGASAMFLHIDPTIATQIESGGVLVAGITVDFDGDTRNVTTPDIGADEFTGIPLDIVGPSISYTAFGNTALTTNRNLTVTITDASGVAGGALAPRIYFRKNAGAYVSTQCTGTSPTYTCTIDYSLVGGVVPTDVIDYFVIAQDTVGNVSINPSGGAVATDVNTVITPPTTPNTYTVIAPFLSTVNVPGDYPSLTNAGGLFEAMNVGAFTGNTVVNITADLAGELGTNALNQLNEEGAGAGTYTVLIKPSGAARMITGSNAGALIRLNGADRVRIDGSTAAMFADNIVGGNPALRELTIQNTNTGTSATVISVGSGTNGAQNNTIQNVNVLGQDPTTTLLGISLGGTTPGTVGTDNDNNRVENCSVKRAIFGIYSAGASLANQNTGTVITMNDLSSTGADRIRRVGIVVFNDNGVQITENSVAVETNESADAVGIGVGSQLIDTTTTTSGGVTNAFVSRNKINGVASLSTTGFSAAGITVAGAVGGPNTIVNNMITGVTAPATSPDIVAGIYVIGVTGSTTRLYHNSISMTGDRGTTTSQLPSYGVAITGTDPTVELKNNIFRTEQTSGGGANAKSYSIGMVTTTFANLDSNYNNFLSIGANAGGFRSGSLAAGAGTDYANLMAWQTAVSDDANSNEVDALFISPVTDLHLDPTSSLIGAGTTIGSVTNDYDSDPRPGMNPDIGADELVQATLGMFPSGTFYNAISGNNNMTGNVTITNSLTLMGVLNGLGNTLTIGCNATVNGAGASNYVNGTVRKDFCATGSFTFPLGGGSMPFTGNSTEGVNQFTPVIANVTALGVNPSSLVGTINTGIAPATPPLNPAMTLNRFWSLTEIGDVRADLTFFYLQSDVAGDESQYNIYRITGGGMPFVFPTIKQSPCNTTSPCIDTTANQMFVGGVQSYSNWLAGGLAPTAALAQIGGQIRTANGQPISGALMTSQNLSNGQRLTATTDSQGRYNFDGQTVAQDYAIAPVLNGYRFEPSQRVISLNGNRSDVDFVAIESTRNPSNDYDGDGIADLAVFRPSEGNWYIWQSSTNSLRVENWGVATDRIVPSDYDGDGRMDLAVYRPSEGNWYIKESFSGRIRVERWGLSDDKVVPSDYDGDGRTDVAVYRQSNNVWYIKRSSDGTNQFETLSEQVTKPVIGDFDGDRRADIAGVVNIGANGQIAFVIKGSRNNTETTQEWGLGNDALMSGDYDGDGRTDLAVYRASESVWYVKTATNTIIRQWGISTDEPLNGDYDGNGISDFAIYRIENSHGYFYILGDNGQYRIHQFGLAGDIPIGRNVIR